MNLYTNFAINHQILVKHSAWDVFHLKVVFFGSSFLLTFGYVEQGLVNVPFWEYWTSPYSSHLVDHIPIMVGWCEKWGHLMTHVEGVHVQLIWAVVCFLNRISQALDVAARSSHTFDLCGSRAGLHHWGAGMRCTVGWNRMAICLGSKWGGKEHECTVMARNTSFRYWNNPIKMERIIPFIANYDQ